MEMEEEKKTQPLPYSSASAIACTCIRLPELTFRDTTSKKHLLCDPSNGLGGRHNFEPPRINREGHVLLTKT